VIEAAGGAGPSGRELRLFVRTSDSLLLAALVAAATRSESDPAALRRLEPVTLTPDELRRWERPLPTTSAPANAPESGAWQGRWFWSAALALLALESWMRRAAGPSAPVEVTHARVA
jgi:hypothetical protein